MPLTVNPLSDTEAVKAAKPSKPSLLRGWYPGNFIDAWETESRRGNPMIAAALTVSTGTEEREFPDWFTASERFAAKVRHACEAVGKLAEYEAGTIAAEYFRGQHVQVRLDVEKGRAGFPARSVIVDYRAASAKVVNLRSAE
jgi:hypothetical protein